MLNNESNIPPISTPTTQDDKLRKQINDVKDKSVFNNPEKEVQEFTDKESSANQEIDAQSASGYDKEAKQTDMFLREYSITYSGEADYLKAEKPTWSANDHFHDYSEGAIKDAIQKEESIECTSPSVSQLDPERKLLHPENWRCLQALPPKYRRPLVLLIMSIIILIIISLLKPQTRNIQSFDNDSLQIASNSGLATHNTENTTIADNFNKVLTGTNTATISSEALSIPIFAPNTFLSDEVRSNDNMINSESTTTSTPVNLQNELTENDDMVNGESTATPTSVNAQSELLENDDIFMAAEKAHLLPTIKASTPSKSMKTPNKSMILIMRHGTSLMQLFRENRLPLADINAMTKIAQGKPFTRLKAGDKVQIKLTPSRHIRELTLPNGIRFIRQANGSYLFEK